MNNILFQIALCKFKVNILTGEAECLAPNTWIDKNSGYTYLNFYVDHKEYSVALHELIAFKVWGNAIEGKLIKHKDGDKDKNEYTNLELV